MTPLQLAKQYCLERGDTEEFFYHQIERHIQDGYVFCNPSVFLLLRPVRLNDGRKAWMINHAVGRISELARFMPFFLPFVAFWRWNQYKKTYIFHVHETRRWLAHVLNDV